MFQSAIKRRLAVLAALCAALFVDAGLARAETRVALVIGVSNYDHTRMLPNASRDAGAVARRLKEMGFDLVGGQAHMDVDLLDELGYAAVRADVALFYFTGHGLQSGNENWLVPQNAVLARESQVRMQTVALESALAQLQGARRLRVAIIDACRDNPLANRMASASGEERSSSTRGLPTVEPWGATWTPPETALASRLRS